jgi:hypothetical protein
MAETGHAPNVAHFEKLISFCEGYGVEYNPSNSELLVTTLKNMLTDVQTKMANVTAAMGPWKAAVNTRSDAFLGIRKRVTRVVNAFAASGAPESAVEDAKGFKRKIDGARAKALKDDTTTPENESEAGISVSQRSYPQLVQHLDDLIALLDTFNAYQPNETDLTVSNLQSYSISLKIVNLDVVNAYPPFSNARIARDAALYGEGSTLVNIAGLVKKYVKSVYGAGSPQFQQVSALEFRRPTK